MRQPTGRKRLRDKETTVEKLIEATGRIIRKDGMHKLGVNAIAREAGVDKVLLYRYFGGLEGLLREFVSRRNFYSTAERSILGAMPEGGTTLDEIVETGKRVLAGQVRALRQNPELQELYRWELLEATPMTEVLAEDREAEGMRLLRLFQQHVVRRGTDVPAISAILVAGLTYLVLRAKTAGIYNGIDIRSERGWERIELGMEEILTAVLRAPGDKHAPRRSPAGGKRFRV
jgi:AcrR family transcriptional regulator